MEFCLINTNKNYTIMNKQFGVWSLLISIFIALSGCEVIGGIFKAGVWTGIIIIVAIVALIIFIISKLGKNK